VKHHHLLALTAYAALTLLMTWPAALHLTDAIPGDGFDGWQNYWNLWWVRESLLVLRSSPFFTDYLYPPTGASLLFHTLNIFNGLWTLPLQLNFGLAVAYNSVVLFSFVFAGYGGYLLCLEVLRMVQSTPHPNPLPKGEGTGSGLPSPLGRGGQGGEGLRGAAFVGGLVFTMAPFHFAHLLGHMQVFSMVWPPFYVLWLLRAWGSNPRLSRLSRLKPTQQLKFSKYGLSRQAVMAALCLILAGLVDWYQVLYLLLFTALALGWAMASRRQLCQPIAVVTVIGGIFGLALSPLLVPMMLAAGRTASIQVGLEQSVALSADLLAFVTPSEFHPLWGGWAQGVATRFSSTTSERTIFAGFVPLALGLLAVVWGRREEMVRFWGASLALFVLLALGPYLHVGGQIVTVAGQSLPLPYLLLYHTLPFIRLTRSLSRYDLMVMLSLGVLVAIAVARMNSPSPPAPLPLGEGGLSSPSPSGRGGLGGEGLSLYLPAIFALLICFEFLPAPYPLSKIEIPPFYVEMGRQTEDYVVAELPMNWDRPTPMLHQTVHHKRLLTAYTSRDNPLDLAWRTPVFQQWRYLEAEIIDHPLAEIAPTIFDDFNLRYIILDYWQMPPGPERDATEQWVAAALPQIASVYDDGRLKVYQAPPKTETHPYLTLGEGWSDRQTDGHLTRQIVGPAAEIFLHHPPSHPFTLELTVAGPPQSLTIFAGEVEADTMEITPTFVLHRVLLPPMAGAWVKLRLQREDEAAGEVFVSRVSLREGE
jgi:hypothetical protein